jgi:protein O-mannosyl-transferase
MRRDNIMKNILVDQNVYFVILLFTTLPFLHTIFFSFSPLDDAVLILGRLEWLQDYKNIYSIFTEPLFAGIGNYYYRPILILTFMIDAITGGGSPVSFHISNIVFHTIASLLVFEIFKKFELSNLVSILAALIFILHPVNISAISWIPGRNDTLLTIFILTSFLQWIKYLKSGNNKYLIFHLISYLIALLTKENAIVLPIISAIYYYFYSQKRSKSQIIRISIFWSFITISWLITRSAILINPQSLDIQSTSQILLDLIIIFCLSVGKLIFPINQAIAPNLLDINPFYPILLTFTFGLVLWIFGLRNKRLALFGCFWALGFALLPELWVSLFNIGYSYEHRLYLPLIGFIIFMSQVKIPSKFSQSTNKLIFMAIIIIIAFGIKSISRSFAYRNYKNFSISLVEESPSMPFAHKFRGDVLSHYQDFTGAELCYNRSLEMNPQQIEVYFNRGNMYQMSGKDSLAMNDYYKTTEIDSLYHPGYFSLGTISAKTKKHNDAIRFLTIAINISDTDSRYFNERGFQYMKLNKFQHALADFSQAILMDPKYITAYQNRSVCNYFMGNFGRSLFDLQEVEILGGDIELSLLDSLKIKLQIR